MLESMGIDLTPTPLIASKEIGREKEKPKFTTKKLLFQPTNSWTTYMIKRTVQDFQQTVLQVCYYIRTNHQLLHSNFLLGEIF